jgi:hypothetical protein
MLIDIAKMLICERRSVFLCVFGVRKVDELKKVDALQYFELVVIFQSKKLIGLYRFYM